MLHFTMVFGAGALVFAAATGLWFVVQRRQRQFFIPVLDALALHKSKTQRFYWENPPWWEFWLFSTMALFLVVLTLKPSYERKVPMQHAKQAVHVLVDLSPSMGAFISEPDLQEQVKQILARENLPNLSFSTSHDPEIVFSKGGDVSIALAQKIQIQRTGASLSHSIEEINKNLPKEVSLFVLTDLDQNSWQNISQALLPMRTQIVDVTTVNQIQNIYFTDVFRSSKDMEGIQEWNVWLGQTQKHDSQGELIVGVENNPEVARVPWQFQNGSTELKLSVLIPSSSLAASKQDFITWKIVPKNNDALAADNEFRSYYSAQKPAVYFVAENFGENLLEDPVYQLEQIFHLLGYTTQRQAYFAVPKSAPGDPKLFVNYINRMNPSCPRPQQRDLTPQDKIWLVPEDQKAVQTICQCFAQWNNEGPAICAEVSDRKNFNELMNTMPVGQVGGTIGSWQEAFAWKTKNTEAPEVLAFNLPLDPYAPYMTRISAPLFVRNLLRWQGSLAEGSNFVGSQKTWPRVEDWGDLKQKDETARLWSNIPLAESEWHKSKETTPQVTTLSQVMAGAKTQDSLVVPDEGHWPWFLFCGLMVLLLLENIFLWWQRKKWTTRKKILVASTLLLACSVPFPFTAYGQSKTQGVAYLSSTPFAPGAISEFAEFLESSTSIALQSEVKNFNTVSEELLTYPMIVARGVGELWDPHTGRMHRRLVDWVKRGGLLIIEGQWAQNSLPQLTDGLFAQGKWQVMPPTHELLKSFYLIEAFPICDGQYWSGFFFDQRTAIVAVPFDLLQTLNRSFPAQHNCQQDYMGASKIMTNIMMMALTTDYKTEQLHVNQLRRQRGQ